MLEVNNLIDLTADENLIVTEIMSLSPSPALNYNNPSNNISCSQFDFSIPGTRTFIASDARSSLDNNPFDQIQKEVNLQDDPFEMVFNQVDNNTSFKTINNNTNNEVITENLLLLGDDLIGNNLNIHKLQNFRSKTSIGQLSNTATNFTDVDTDANKMDFSEISKVNGSDSNNVQLGSISSVMSLDSYYKVSSDNNEISNTLNLSENNNSQSKDNILKTIYSTPDGQSTPNRELDNSSSNSSIGAHSKQLKCHKVDLRNRLLKLSISNSTINSPLASCRRSSKTSDDGSSLELSVFNEASNLSELYSQLITSSPSSNNFSEDSCDDLMSIKPNWIDSKSDIDSDLELLKIPILDEIDISKNKSNNSTGNETNYNSFKITTPQKRDLKSLKNDSNETETLTSNLDKLKKKIKQHKIKNNTQDINELINGLKSLIFECTQDAKKNEASNLLESLSSLLGDDINKSNDKSKDNITNQSQIHNENVSSETNTTKKTISSPKPIIRQDTFDLDFKNENLPEVDEGIITVENQHNIDYETEEFYDDENSQQEIEPELANIVEQIGKLLGGTQNVNVVTTNLNQNSTDINGQLLNTNPTYIVVMGTPSKRKISKISYDNSPNDLTQMRRRSQSFSLHDKRLKLPTTTPVTSNYIGRRNSFSTATPVGRSIPKTSSINEKAVTPQLHNRRSMLIETKNYSSKPIVNFRNDFNSKQLKFKTVNDESTIRSKGPLKATIPVKRVAPLIVTSSISLPTDHARQSYKPTTSTPVAGPSKSSNNKMFAKPCSTPRIVVSSSTTDLISPARNINKNRTRYSYASTTPHGKSSLSAQSSIGQRNRRKSFTETPTKRSLHQDEFAKTLKSFKIGNHAAVQKSSLPTTLNKENKQPRPGL